MGSRRLWTSCCAVMSFGKTGMHTQRAKDALQAACSIAVFGAPTVLSDAKALQATASPDKAIPVRIKEMLSRFITTKADLRISCGGRGGGSVGRYAHQVFSAGTAFALRVWGC